MRPITPTLNSDNQLREFRIGYELKFEFLLLIDEKLCSGVKAITKSVARFLTFYFSYLRGEKYL